MQKSPRPLITRLIVSAVAVSAAQMKSPSFSRASSSRTMTTLPILIASTASGIDENDLFILFLRLSELMSTLTGR